MPPDGMSGGGKLDAYLRNIVARTGGAKEVRAGFLEGSTEESGSVTISMPLLAALNEFGAPSRGQPPRPFMRVTVAAHKGEWPDQLGKKLVADNYDANRALAGMGEVIVAEIRQSIAGLVSPPLAASTIARKGSDKPLIASGQMFQGVDSEVVGE